MGEAHGRVLLVGLLVSGLIGSEVDHAKHAPTYEGFLWRFFLAPLGWLLAGLLFQDGRNAKADMDEKMPRARVLARQQNATKAKRGVADEMGKLAALRSAGALTEDEFTEQKRRLLAQ